MPFWNSDADSFERMVISRTAVDGNKDDDDGTATDRAGSSVEEEESSEDAPRRASTFAMVAAVDVRIMVTGRGKQGGGRTKTQKQKAGRHDKAAFDIVCLHPVKYQFLFSVYPARGRFVSK